LAKRTLIFFRRFLSFLGLDDRMMLYQNTFSSSSQNQSIGLVGDRLHVTGDAVLAVIHRFRLWASIATGNNPVETIINPVNENNPKKIGLECHLTGVLSATSNSDLLLVNKIRQRPEQRK
jgi:hypothetical protein